MCTNSKGACSHSSHDLLSLNSFNYVVSKVFSVSKGKGIPLMAILVRCRLTVPNVELSTTECTALYG